jgi:Anp1 protein
MSEIVAETAPRVLILTPVKDAARHLDRYVANIEMMDYPQASLSIGVLESDSRDETMMSLERLLPRLQARGNRVTLARRDFGFKLPPGVPRWAPAFQEMRRCVLARARNHLLFAALRDEAWVLWLDVDVIDYPPDLIRRLLAFGRDILHPHCVLAPGGPTFDRNGWVDHGAKLLQDFRGGPQPVRLDAVGASVLLVRADHHRDGLVFPPFPYGRRSEIMRPDHELWGQGEIESEGLGMLAHDMGLQCWGVADLEVLHASE